MKQCRIDGARVRGPSRKWCNGLLAILLGVAGSWTCGDRGGAGEDLPVLETRCETCHDIGTLTAKGPGEGLEAGHWAGMAAMGLVRLDPLFPEPGTWWAVPWPERGRHEQGSDCSLCHPVGADGSGHGLRVYPLPEKAFAGGQDCATGCHLWIPPSEQPGVLLGGGNDRHGVLWRQGKRPDDPSAFRMSAFQPGCGGCHNGTAEDHGAIRDCLDCHDFQGPRSAIHQTHREVSGSCDFCHVGEEGPNERSRRACRNCHPSGHRPR